MSYAIIRNEKLTRAEAQGRCVHNDRRAKNHTNKDIDVSKSYLNYYIKKNELKRNYPSDYWDKFYANFSYEQAVAN